MMTLSERFPGFVRGVSTGGSISISRPGRDMDAARTQGVFSHLHLLERGALGLIPQEDPAQNDRVDDLKAVIHTLRARRDELRVQADRTRELRHSIDKGDFLDEEDYRTGENSEIRAALLTAKQTELKKLLKAHHLIGGYDLIETQPGKRFCVSLHTAYEGTYCTTYHLELDLTRTVQVVRHDVPPSMPLDTLVQQNLQTNLPAFLHSLSLHLNALTSRQQQIVLVKDQIKSVDVLESNQLCSVLVLLCRGPKQQDPETLVTLLYRDLTSELPTQVTVESEDDALPNSPQWKKSKTLLLDQPVHKALEIMNKTGVIA
ncbi:centromere protein O [Denticeps clupeoides]|uniref:Centromere protein O n=1 Tax=Denticeps clupeoides TaxID=299321 RepID=A0AAY4CBM5_9TELE|nr:centromere protein O [Denticeps clupeoides]